MKNSTPTRFSLTALCGVLVLSFLVNTYSASAEDASAGTVVYANGDNQRALNEETRYDPNRRPAASTDQNQAEYGVDNAGMPLASPMTKQEEAKLAREVRRSLPPQHIQNDKFRKD